MKNEYSLTLKTEKIQNISVIRFTKTVVDLQETKTVTQTSFVSSFSVRNTVGQTILSTNKSAFLSIKIKTKTTLSLKLKRRSFTMLSFVHVMVLWRTNLKRTREKGQRTSREFYQFHILETGNDFSLSNSCPSGWISSNRSRYWCFLQILLQQQ